MTVAHDDNYSFVSDVHCRQCHCASTCLIGSTLPQVKGQPVEHFISSRLLHRKDVVFHYGEHIEHLYILRSGTTKASFLNPAGEEQVIRFNHAGDILAINDLGGSYYQSSVRALETSSLCRIPYVIFQELLTQNPEFHKSVLGYISQQFNITTAHSLLISRFTASERVAAFLLMMSDAQRSRGYSPQQLRLSMSRHDIASYLGMSSETLSRTLTSFQEIDLIRSIRKGVQVNDLGKLEHLTGQLDIDKESTKVYA